MVQLHSFEIQRKSELIFGRSSTLMLIMVTLQWTRIPSRAGGIEMGFHSHFMLQGPEISVGLMGHILTCGLYSCIPGIFRRIGFIIIIQVNLH